MKRLSSLPAFRRLPARYAGIAMLLVMPLVKRVVALIVEPPRQ